MFHGYKESGFTLKMCNGTHSYEALCKLNKCLLQNFGLFFIYIFIGPNMSSVVMECPKFADKHKHNLYVFFGLFLFSFLESPCNMK